jgi:carboxymethylenebutenolidase
MPVPGQVVDSEAIQTTDLTFFSDGWPIAAFMASPRRPGARPAIIVLEEIFGVNEHIRDVTRRLAAAGFTALAPELFSRAGRPEPWAPIETTLARAQRLPDSQIIRDLDNAAAFLVRNGASKLGCIGFCLGGRNSLMYACRGRGVDATIDCWGGYIFSASATERVTAARPTPVGEMIDGLRGALYVVCGEEDKNPSPEQAAELSERLRKAGKQATLEVFEKAGHAFFADYRPGYRRAAAAILWSKILAFFESHLRR